MKSRTYHGDVHLQEFTGALAGYFNRGALSSTARLDGNQAVVQIGTRQGRGSGGSTHLGVILRKVDDRLEVQVGEQAALGLAASLGASALLTLLNPWNLLGRLDDIAIDFEHLSLEDQVWAVVDRLAAQSKASRQLSDRLRRAICSYCGVANPLSEGRCLACGAPLGDVQPDTCPNCGYVVLGAETQCPNCGYRIVQIKDVRSV